MPLAQYVCKGLKIEYPGKAPYAFAPISNDWCSATVPRVSLMRNSHCAASKGKLFTILCGFPSPSPARHTETCTTIIHTQTCPRKTRGQLNQDGKAQKLACSLHTAAYLS